MSRVTLGPIPEIILERLPEWIEQSGEELGVLLTGGPGGSHYLNSKGQVIQWDAWKDKVSIADDETALAAVFLGSQHRPELSAWLPARPTEAEDCSRCNNSGWLPIKVKLVCDECHGMGWKT